jgi:hypothetical protein
VEGSELLVFRGALELMKRPAELAPVFVFEYAPANYARFGYGPDELLEFLEQNGYGVWCHAGVGRVVPFQPVFAQPRTMNLLAARNVARLRL